MDPTAGTLFAGRFRLEEGIGAGGMGTVWRARDEELGRHVAIKLMKAGIDDSERERFEREARVMCGLSHPGVLKLYDAGVSESRAPFLVMELLDGESLSERFRAGSMELPELLEILRGMLDGLAHVHQRQIVHRDVKPSNIFLRASGEPLLIDFGLAWSADLTAITVKGDVLGTPAYMAPELVTEGFRFTPASDLYAVGCIAFEGLTGRSLHASVGVPVSIQSILRALHTGAYFEVAQRMLATRGPLGAVVLAALARQPAERHPSASAMLMALNRAAGKEAERRREPERDAAATSRSGSASPARRFWARSAGAPAPPGAIAPPPRRRAGSPRLLAALVLVAVTAGVSVGVIAARRPKPVRVETEPELSSRPPQAPAVDGEARAAELKRILTELSAIGRFIHSAPEPKALSALPPDQRRMQLRVALTALNRHVSALEGLLERAARYSGPGADQLLELAVMGSLLCDRIDDAMLWAPAKDAATWLPSALHGFAADPVGEDANPYAALVRAALIPCAQGLLKQPHRLTPENRAATASKVAAQLLALAGHEHRRPGTHEAVAICTLLDRAAQSWGHFQELAPEASPERVLRREKHWQARRGIVELVSTRLAELDLRQEPGLDFHLAALLFGSACMLAAEPEAPRADRLLAFGAAMAVGRRIRLELTHRPVESVITGQRLEDLRGAASSLRIAFDPSTLTRGGEEPAPEPKPSFELPRAR